MLFKPACYLATLYITQAARQTRHCSALQVVVAAAGPTLSSLASSCRSSAARPAYLEASLYPYFSLATMTTTTPTPGLLVGGKAAATAAEGSTGGAASTSSSESSHYEVLGTDSPCHEGCRVLELPSSSQAAQLGTPR